MKYRYLLLDNDNTLMDFHAAERKALSETLTEAGIPATPETCTLYSVINDALWKALERGEIAHAALKVERFSRLISRLGRTDADAASLAARYAHHLSTHADLLPGAEEFVRRMHQEAKIALISNGVSEIQRGRLSRCPFTPELDAVIISAEHGISKPDPRLVEIALEALGCTDRHAAILVGDSMTADIPAANAAGIDSLYIGWQGQTCDKATWNARDLAEVERILRNA